MVTLTDTKKSSEAEDRVVGFARSLVEHHVVDAAAAFAGRVVDRRPINLTGSDQPSAGVTRVFNAGYSPLRFDASAPSQLARNSRKIGPEFADFRQLTAGYGDVIISACLSRFRCGMAEMLHVE
jgi:hypothetical protein